ncbi:hypothetical protein DPMN_007927 [Dreissena polymorpha]|uniref:Fibrinogen C-terminal domain-containing protein n=2 Tax=Dreissena polymorpha TaxID=45954 RepID=A0A9D4MU65_DREPO|nr:hypothetical protein DPMN_007927 [Dreissena polymorpha]
MPLRQIISLVLTLLSMEVCSQQPPSLCSTMQYRSLSPELQNEHQCMVLERLQLDFNDESRQLKEQYQNLYNIVNKFQHQMLRSIEGLKLPTRDSAQSIPSLRDIPLVRDCNELYQNGILISGVYPIRLPNRQLLNLWCDMTTANGGWTVLQRRMNGSVNFTRNWEDYAFGFGNVNTEYWIGNEHLYRLSNSNNYTLRIEMWDWEGKQSYAEYDSFQVDSEQLQYALHIGGYTGTAGDALSKYHNNMPFSTVDQDNDQWHLSCAQKDQAGWWYKACGFSSLNGLYIENSTVDLAPDGIYQGIIWYQWKNTYAYSMKRTEIKIKPVVQVKLDRLIDKKFRAKNKADKTKDKESSTDISGTVTANPPVTPVSTKVTTDFENLEEYDDEDDFIT